SRLRGRGGSRRGRRDQGAVAALGGGGRGPARIAPAQLVGAVLPDEFSGAVRPVVKLRAPIGSGHASLRPRGGGQRSGGKHQRDLVQFLHGSPLGEKAAAGRREN